MVTTTSSVILATLALCYSCIFPAQAQERSLENSPFGKFGTLSNRLNGRVLDHPTSCQDVNSGPSSSFPASGSQLVQIQQGTITPMQFSSSSQKQTSNKCFTTKIIEPVPFQGNGGELFILEDGSVWKEISHQHLHLHEYDPVVTVCPGEGKMILKKNIFTIMRIK